ncbi:hypothetical protein CCYA_CCYA09G2716 [Cyanidiococcus yangmingshanensis]|uniref:Uncharacterized protein n=1 Tax=Cyanidiococcus yangmingshanensis TaxID=2690220 RepID=A0A7J7IJB3_9RHOD|nr:hypothetical protein F1559_004341 [Cyanidiococcus yangmingshanensis]KAK4531859.1 hypothetical protein CCYA_CCYA09G2716 [Cyanidiococcus yangmingshanensis]
MTRHHRGRTLRDRGRVHRDTNDGARRLVEVPPQPDRLSVTLDESAAKTFPSGESSLASGTSDSDRPELEEVRLTEDTGFTGDAEELSTEVATDYWWLQGLLPYLADSQEQPLQKREDILRGLGHRARWLLKSLRPEDAFGRCTLRQVLTQEEMSSSDQIIDSLDSWLGLSNEPE